MVKRFMSEQCSQENENLYRINLHLPVEQRSPGYQIGRTRDLFFGDDDRTARRKGCKARSEQSVD